MPEEKRTYEMLESGLIARDIIRAPELEKAREFSRSRDISLVAALIEGNFVLEEELARIISEIYDIPFLSPEELEKNRLPSAAGLLAESFTRDHLVMPLKISDNTLEVAMADPLDFFLLEEMRMRSGFEVEPRVATRSAIKKEIENVYEQRTAPPMSAPPDKKLEITLSDGTRAEAGSEILPQEGDEAIYVGLANFILVRAIEEGVDEIHLEPLEKQLSLYFLTGDKLRCLNAPPLSALKMLVKRFKLLALCDVAGRSRYQEGFFEVKLEGKHVKIEAAFSPGEYGEIIALSLCYLRPD